MTRYTIILVKGIYICMYLFFLCKNYFSDYLDIYIGGWLRH